MSYQTRVIFDGNAIIPAPLVSFSREYSVTPDGTKIGSVYTVTIHGFIVADKGSPNSDGEFWTNTGYPPDEDIPPESRLTSILTKQKSLSALFSSVNDGKTLEIICGDGLSPLSCNPRIQGITFTEGIYYHVDEYTITLECDKINGLSDDEFPDFISSADETWTIEVDEERGGTQEFLPTYRLTHTVTATGKRAFNDHQLIKPAWQNARDWVLQRIGLDFSVFVSGIYNFGGYEGYNHLRSEQIGELNGTYTVTETWILSSGTAIEDFDVSVLASIQDPLTRVSIQGTVRGLDEKVDGVIVNSRIQNAELKFSGIINSIYNRAKTYSGKDLNPIPTTSTVGKNITQGIINYQYEYDNRPSNNITGAISEVINLSDSTDVDLFAIVPVLGKVDGPVIQDLQTKREKARQLSIEVFFEPVTGSITERFVNQHPAIKSPQKEEIQEILETLKPANAKISEHNEAWDGISHYSKNITWVYV